MKISEHEIFMINVPDELIYGFTLKLRKYLFLIYL